MNVKILHNKSKSGDLIAKEVEMTASFDEKCFSGETLMNEGTPVVVMSNKNGKHTDFVSGDSCLWILSDKAKMFFEEHVKYSKIEFISINVTNYNGNEKFWVLNILEVLKCFDWENSEYTLFDELAPNGEKVIDQTSKILFKNDVVNQREIFHSYEFPVELFISKPFEEKLLASDLIGYKILK